jgi:hypothetical protein
VDTAYGSTFDMNGHNFRIGGDCDLGSDSFTTVGITFQKGTGTLVFAGTTSLNFARASWGGSSSTIEWTGTHTLLAYYNGGNVSGTQNLTGSLTISPWSTNSWSYAWSQGTINGTLTANNNIQFMGGGSLDVSISDNSTIAGTGMINFSGNSNCDLTIGSNVTFSVATVQFSAYRLTLHGDFVADNNVTISRWTTTSDQFTFAGNNVFSVGGDLTVISSQGGSWNHSSKDVFYTFKGDVIYNGGMNWNAGGGTIIFDNSGSQSVNFNGQTVEGIHVTDASTGSIVLASDFSTAWLRDCDSLIDLNGYTITNADSVDRCVYPYDPPATIALDSAAAINSDQELWLPLVDGSGSAAADIAGSNNGLITNATWTSSKVGTSLNINGTGAYVQASIASTVFDSSFTIASWFLSQGTGLAGNSPVFSVEATYAGGNYTNGSYIALGFRNTAGYVVLHNGNGIATPHAVSVLDSNWHLFVLDYDPSDGSYNLYLDGSLLGSGTRTKFSSPTGSIRFFGGGFYDTSDHVSGGQNVRVWSRALSSSEVSSLYSDPWIGSDYTAVVPPSNRFFSPAAFARLG